MQIPPYKKKVLEGPIPSKRSTNVLEIKNPHKKAKHMIIELEILLTLGGNNSAVTKNVTYC